MHTCSNFCIWCGRFLGAVIVIAANAGGAWTPIGDVTTTMLWIHGQISTLQTMKVFFFFFYYSEYNYKCLWFLLLDMIDLYWGLISILLIIEFKIAPITARDCIMPKPMPKSTRCMRLPPEYSEKYLQTKGCLRSVNSGNPLLGLISMFLFSSSIIEILHWCSFQITSLCTPTEVSNPP